jgi:phosphopentomutase
VAPRAVLLVLDGVGAGALPDAADYGDEGADTLGNLARASGGLSLPGLARLGLGNLHPIEGVPPADPPEGAWGRLAELSRGKDSTTGHWEMMGLCSCTPFPTYPDGFPPEVVGRFEQETGRSILGNRAASGTAIIEELGQLHLESGALIVYTSADSVFQIAAHEDVVPVELLYEYCSMARAILTPPHGVARVIARPFTGAPGSFVRTARRRDFSLPPPGRTLLDDLAGSGIPVTGVGKVDDLFAHRSISTVHVADNAEGLSVLERQIASAAGGLIFANLVDFDTRWGHRNDVRGFAEGLAEADRGIAALRPLLRAEDLFIVTADHGNDPTTPGTDHTREYAPLLAFGPGVHPVPLGTRRTFADIAATLAEHFGLAGRFGATSFRGEVMD